LIRHGDFGPNNVLFDPVTMRVTALLDWEFSGIGDAIDDIAWCDWIVRMHHPAATVALPKFFEAYGCTPAWEKRRSAWLTAALNWSSSAAGGTPTDRVNSYGETARFEQPAGRVKSGSDPERSRLARVLDL